MTDTLDLLLAIPGWIVIIRFFFLFLLSSRKHHGSRASFPNHPKPNSFLKS